MNFPSVTKSYFVKTPIEHWYYFAFVKFIIAGLASFSQNFLFLACAPAQSLLIVSCTLPSTFSLSQWQPASFLLSFPKGRAFPVSNHLAFFYYPPKFPLTFTYQTLFAHIFSPARQPEFKQADYYSDFL